VSVDDAYEHSADCLVAYLQVIEARELKSRDAGGTSDPICFVTVHNQKQKTSVIKATLNALWVSVFHSCRLVARCLSDICMNTARRTTASSLTSK